MICSDYFNYIQGKQKLNVEADIMESSVEHIGRTSSIEKSTNS